MACTYDENNSKSKAIVLPEIKSLIYYTGYFTILFFTYEKTDFPNFIFYYFNIMHPCKTNGSRWK